MRKTEKVFHCLNLKCWDNFCIGFRRQIFCSLFLKQMKFKKTFKNKNKYMNEILQANKNTVIQRNWKIKSDCGVQTLLSIFSAIFFLIHSMFSNPKVWIYNLS